MMAVPLAEALDEHIYGGKAVQLGAAVRGGLPVPPGLALGYEFVDAVCRRDPQTRATLDTLRAGLGGPVAVRSSAIGEDSASASFAGQHATVLDVGHVADAVETVWRSASTESAMAYRQRVGATGPVRMGAVVQRLVAADVAGVLFTRHPVTGADELLIEASLGLGESVVQGLVVPDQFRVDRSGAVLSRRPGSKDTTLRVSSDGEIRRERVPPELVETLCLTDANLRSLFDLVALCERVYGATPHDIEWAIERGELYLLQRRPVTGSTG